MKRKYANSRTCFPVLKKQTVKNNGSRGGSQKRGIRNVTIAARGTSDHAAIYGQYLLAITAGIPCGLATPSAVSKYGADIDYSGHLVIGISQSGMAEDVIYVIEDAKNTEHLRLR